MSWFGFFGKKKTANEKAVEAAMKRIPPELLADLARQMSTLHLYETYSLMCAAQDREDYELVAKICCEVLGREHPEGNSEMLLSFALNLSWALALSPKAWKVASSILDVLSSIESAVAYLSTRNEPERLASALNNLGTMTANCPFPDLSIVQRHEKAIKAYEKSIEIYSSLGDKFASRTAEVLLHRSVVVRARLSGDKAQNVESAIASAQAALQICIEHKDVAKEAKANSYLGVAHVNRKIGLQRMNWELARQYFERALFLWKQIGNGRSATEEAINLAAAELELGRLDSNRDLIQTGFDRIILSYKTASLDFHALQIPAMREALVGHSYMAATGLHTDERWEEVQRLCSDLAGLMRREGLGDHEFFISVHRGEICTGYAVANPSDEAFQRALDEVGKATSDAQAIGMAHLTINSRNTLAMLLARANHFSKAAELFESVAQDGWPHFRQSISISEQRWASEPVVLAYQGLAYVQARQGQCSEALCSIDRVLAPTLRQSLIATGTPDDEATLARREYWSLMSRLESGKFFDQSLSGNIDVVNRLRQLQSQIDLDENQDVGSQFTVSELASAIPRDGALLIPLMLGELDLECLCVTRGEEGVHVSSFSCNGLNSEVISHTISLSPFLSKNISNMRNGAAGDEYLQACSSLAKYLLTPLEAYLASLGVSPSCAIVFITRGKLSYLPLHALWNLSDEFSSRTVSLAPSVRWLIDVAQQARTFPVREAIVAVCDSQDDLPASRLEGTLIDQACKMLVGTQATRRNVLAAFREASFIHIAGHSKFEGANSFLSSIELADGKLTLANLASEQSGAPETVVLSSCSSGLNDGFLEGADSWGFPLALHALGTRRVISCLWPVFDVTMLLYFSEFYRNPAWRTEPAKALTEARAYIQHLSESKALERLSVLCERSPTTLQLLQSQLQQLVRTQGTQQPFRHPVHWAGLVISSKG